VAGIIGIPGRLQLDWVAAFARNPRPTSSECAAEVDLSPKTQAALAVLVTHKASTDRVFPITTKTFRAWVKRWAAILGRDPALYAGHSTRRTLPVATYKATKDIVACKDMLGHRSTEWTSSYCRTNLNESRDAKRRVLGY
jgi:hypothetical protein